MSDSSLWSVGLEAWIIQDGNYSEFKVGRRKRFALEFEVVGDLVPLSGVEVEAKHVHDASYDIAGRVVHTDDDCCVLDVGVLAYHDGDLPGLRPGQMVSGRVRLGVDPFMYLEELSRNPACPDMVYTWDVRAIRRETAPFVTRGELSVRDQSKLHRVEVRRTNAWNDDDGCGDYVLDCELVDLPPARSKKAADRRRSR